MQTTAKNPSRFRLKRLVRFSLLTFLVAVAVLAGAFGWARHRAEQQRLAVEWIESQGGYVRYEHYRKLVTNVYYSTGSDAQIAQRDALRPDNSWLANLLGEQYVHRIESIDFYDKRLAGEIWRFQHAHGVQRIGFDECDVSAETLEAISKCKALESISISDCYCDSDGLRFLANLPSLKEIYLYRIHFAPGALAHLGRCVALESLNMTYCTFPAEEVEHLKSLDKLTYCDFGFTPVADEHLGVVKFWPNLRRIDLSDRVTDAGLDHLTGLKNLDSLAFLQSKITDAGIVKLMKLPKLKTIQMSNCQLSDELMARLSVNKPHWEISYVQ